VKHHGGNQELHIQQSPVSCGVGEKVHEPLSLVHSTWSGGLYREHLWSESVLTVAHSRGGSRQLTGVLRMSTFST